jgi:LysR family hydrogen peroxide-inducible transcriptional activator
VLPAVRQAYPRLRFILREEQTARVLAQLDDGRLDCGVLALPVHGDLAALELYREDFVLAAPTSHRLARRARLREADLEGEEVLLLEDGHCLRDQALSVCSHAGSREVAELRATSLPTLVQMVAAGAGVTLLPELSLATEARRGRQRLRPFAEPQPHRTIALAWRKGSPLGTALRKLAGTMRGAYPKRSQPL